MNSPLSLSIIIKSLNPSALVGLLVTIICLNGCATADHSGAAVVVQWNARFNPQAGDASLTTPWSRGTPTMSVSDFVYEGIAVKDYEYKKYIDLIRRGTSWGGFGAQTATIGLNAAGTLTTSGTTKVLSGIAGAITGTSAAFSKNILFDQSITTFISKMDALRLTKLAEIKTNLSKENINDYSLAEAYRDIEDYGRLGTLDAAFADVGKKAGQEQEQAKNTIQSLAPGAGASTTTTTTTTNTRKTP